MADGDPQSRNCPIPLEWRYVLGFYDICWYIFTDVRYNIDYGTVDGV